MTNAVPADLYAPIAIEQIAWRLPFFVIHKTAYGRTHYLTDNATWTRYVERAAAFYTAQDATDYTDSLKKFLVEGSKVSPVEYFKNGTVGVA